MKGWRTLMLNLGISLFGVLEATDWSGALGSDKAGWVVTGIGIGNMVLRTLTTTAIGKAS